MRAIYLSISFSFLLSCTRTKQEKTGSYKAGFRIIRIVDKSRIYKPNTDINNYLHFRPIDIDIWYPAITSAGDTALLFRDILGLLEKRANYYTASNAGYGMTRQIAQNLCTGFKCSDTGTLLNYKTRTFQNATSVNKKFPLVIYMCAYNGMSFENFTLFEELATKGFVVVSISSIGRYPGDMTMKNEDLLQQVDDAVIFINSLRQSSNIDLSKIGIIGYSWGGLSAAILSNRLRDVACVISLDGSEFHHYGTEKNEDVDFNATRNSDEFRKLHLSIPYLRLESSPIVGIAKEDSVYNFAEKLADKKIFKVDSTQHEDYSCLGLAVRASGNCKNNQYFNSILKLTTSFLEDNLKSGNSFPGVVKSEADRIIKKQ